MLHQLQLNMNYILMLRQIVWNTEDAAMISTVTFSYNNRINNLSRRINPAQAQRQT